MVLTDVLNHINLYSAYCHQRVFRCVLDQKQLTALLKRKKNAQNTTK